MGILQPEGACIPVRGRSARVAVVYEHPLLGEGVARLLRAATRVDVVAVSGEDARGLTALLAAGPWVVLIERGPLLDALDLSVSAPAATVIDLILCQGPPDPLRGKPIDLPEVIDEVLGALARQSRHRTIATR